MNKSMHRLICAAVLLGMPLYAAAIESAELLAAYKKNRNKARAEYDGKAVEISGKVTRELIRSNDCILTIDDAVDVVIGKKGSTAEAYKIYVEASKEAREFNRAERQKRLKIKRNHRKGQKEPPERELVLSIVASGTCVGVRSGKVQVKEVATASVTKETVTK